MTSSSVIRSAVADRPAGPPVAVPTSTVPTPTAPTPAVPTPAVPTPGRASADARRTVRLEAVGSDPEAAITDIAGLYAGREWAAHATDGTFDYRYTAIGDEDLTLRRSRITGQIRGSIPGTDDYVLQWITEGEGVPDTRRDRVALTRGIPMLFPTDREFVFEYRDYDQRLVHLSRRLVADVAVERYHATPGADLALDHLRPVDPAAVTRWRQQTAVLVTELRRGVGTLLWQTVTRRTAAMFLDLYPPTVPVLPPAALLPRRARLRAAIEYVHAHAHAPITVSDIADAAGLSVRALQETFQRNIGRTPMAYLLEVRLEQVRTELLRADPATTTVQQVARRWGFSHLGRFSGTYAAAYGEYPKHTLRR